MSQPDKPERPTEWPATVNTPYGPQENISEREYIDLERQGLVRSFESGVNLPPQSARTTSSRTRDEASVSDSKEN